MIIKHNDSTAGVPDLSITFRKRTSWWEVKHAAPKLNGTDLQRLTAQRLSLAGDCWYIIYEDQAAGLSTCVVHPRDINDFNVYSSHERVSGYDHEFVVKFIRAVHSR